MCTWAYQRVICGTAITAAARPATAWHGTPGYARREAAEEGQQSDKELIIV